MEEIVIGVMAFILIFVLMVLMILYFTAYQRQYRKAKNEILAFVKSYKRRCTGNNRFLVTVETLQDSFREYDTPVIERIWKELVDSHVIERDQQDNEWVIR